MEEGGGRRLPEVMSAGKLVKGIVKRLLNSSDHHQHQNHDNDHRPEKVSSSYCALHDESNKDVIREAEGCWRRQRRNSQRSKQCKKVRSPNEDKRPLALPDVVPKEDFSTSCHHHCKTPTPDDFCCCGHYYHHHVCDDIENPTSRSPDPVCVCEDCYLALMNICKRGRQTECCDRLLHSRRSTCMGSSDGRGDTKASTESQLNRGSQNLSIGKKRSCRLQLQTEKRIISTDWSIVSSDGIGWAATVDSGTTTRFSESPKSGTSASGDPTARTSTAIDLPPSICLTKDGEQSYGNYVKGLASRERLFSYRSSVVPPNRTICHVTAAS